MYICSTLYDYSRTEQQKVDTEGIHFSFHRMIQHSILFSMRVEKWRTKSNIKIMKIPNWQCRTVKPTLELRVIWYFIYPQSLAVSNSTDFNSGVVCKNYITHVKQSSKQGNKVQCKTVHSSRRRYKKRLSFSDKTWPKQPYVSQQRQS